MARKRHPFAQYFADVWSGIATTVIGMKLTFKYLFRKPVTMLYPEERPEVPEGYRGIHVLIENKCAVCGGCAKACPVGCITIESIGKGKDQLLTRFDIDYSKCLFCDLCTSPCPSAAIAMSQAYDASTTTREGCVLHLARPKSAEEIAAHNAMLAAKEAEKKAKAEAEKKAKEAAAAAAAAEAEKQAAEKPAE